MAVDASGNAIVVWSQYASQRFNIWSKRYSSITGWGTAARIESHEDFGYALNPKIVVDPNGSALAVWQQSDGAYEPGRTRGNIWSNRYRADIGWGTAELIGRGGPWGTDDTYNQTDPRIAIDSEGNATVVWYADHSICATRYNVSTGWGKPEVIGGDRPFYPQIAMDPKGNVLAMWWQFAASRTYYLWSNHYTAGVGWDTPEMIPTNNAPSSYPPNPPKFVIDENGNVLAVWVQAVAYPFCTRPNVWANRYTFGTGWGTAQVIDNSPGDCGSGGGYGAGPIVTDSNGNALAMWVKWSGLLTQISWNRYSAGTEWNMATVLETGDVGSPQVPAIAMEPNGNAVAVWVQVNGTHNQMWSSRYTASAGWGTPTPIETSGTRSAYNFHIASNGRGKAMAVWTNADGATTSIWAYGF